VLRTNLSTRPFYNERAVQLLLALAALLVVVLTAFNAIRIFSLSRQNTELSSLVNRDRLEAQRLTREAQRIRAGINVEELQATADAAAVANALIDQRTFSWTEFFNRIEETLPPDVMLTSVQPSFGREATIIQMSVLGRQIEDIDEFMEKLEATGAFHDVLPTQEDTTDEGLHRLMVRSTYTGTASEAPEGPAPAQAPKPEPAKPDSAKPEPAKPESTKPESTKPPAGAAPPPATPPQPAPSPGATPAQPSPGGRARRGAGR
jgi:Tfp pilus assembly protein PilN